MPQFQSILKRPERLFYPDLKDKLEKVKQIWVEKLNVKVFIVESLQCLVHQPSLNEKYTH